MRRIGEADFGKLEDELNFLVDNIHHPKARLQDSGRLYEEASEALRAHGILRLLVDADAKGFSNDLVMSGHARRAFLRRCRREGYEDYFVALSRSGAFFDAVAANDLALGAEIFSLSPEKFRPGDEYEDDFWWHRFVGLILVGGRDAEAESALAPLAALSPDGARLSAGRAIRARDATGFEDAFQALLREREKEIEEEKPRELDDLAVAVGAKLFVEGIAVLRLARRAGVPTAREYPMCPLLALLDGPPATPADEFGPPA